MASLTQIAAPKPLLFVLLVLFCIPNEVCARKRNKPPLIEDPPRRRVSKLSHCQFGNQSYAIEERWRPNLGPPFGVLFCVHCECIAVQRKHRKEMVARVRCKNIKNDCPKPSCDNPVLLPEGCCKTCPGEGEGKRQLLSLANVDLTPHLYTN
ncbi:chordin-like protein [Leptotrombidium deliense]|uniref:Chordin-like protein n=1 Tax=Leptotrombidium deliense TaxID=299467 RepID=A0A443SKI5_9ACAR|nr:chordin-like protein [Leptotrombidium deliense]